MFCLFMVLHFVMTGVDARYVAMLLGMQVTPRLIPASGTFSGENLVMKSFYGHFPSSVIQEEQLSVTGERIILSAGKLHLGGYPMNSEVRIIDSWHDLSCLQTN